MAERLGRRRMSLRSRLVRPRVAVGLACGLALLAGAWLWLRDSPLVAVQRVTVTGERGPDAAQIRRALIAAASTMTTLDVDMGRLRMAVAPFPVVKDLRVSTQFPHALRIEVIEQIPVADVVVGGRSIAVAGDGTLLHDVAANGSLPVIPVRVAPGGSRLTDPATRAAVAVLAAAPYQLLAHVSQVTQTAAHGLVAQLRAGPSIYFGDVHHLGAKWTAATGVLADGGSAGALYIDVTDPGRPAAGAGTTGSASAGGTSAAATASASSTAAAAPTASAGSTAAAAPTASTAAATPTASAGLSASAGPSASNTATTPAGG